MPSPGAFAEALRAERRKKRRRTWIVASVGGTLVVLAVVLGWLFFFSTVLEVRDTSVDGNQLLTGERIEEQAQVPGGPLARVDVAAIESRLLELPEIKEVDVRRDFPNTVAIAVTEREPVYQLRSDGGFSWVDDEGYVFRTGQQANGELPEASVAEPDERLLGDVATVVQNLPEQLAGEVELVTAETVDRVEIELTEGRTVVWGSADESELKQEVLAALLSVDATHYDVSAPNHPTTS